VNTLPCPATHNPNEAHVHAADCALMPMCAVPRLPYSSKTSSGVTTTQAVRQLGDVQQSK